ncbi:MAG TPA: hypothetical protein VIF57_21290 [Polyangia bacterium]
MLPLSMQAGAPVVQLMDPVRQGLLGVQALPAAQAAHAPLLQIMFVPQTVPFACAVWVSVHDATPLAEQAICPTWHALVGVQTPPGVHDGTSVPPSGDPPLPPAPALPPRPPAPPITEPPTPALPPPMPPLPAAPALPPAPPIIEPPVPPRPALPVVPPRPPTLTVPPAPAVPSPPSGSIGSTRRPHPRPAHPHRTDTHTSRWNIMSPVFRNEGCNRSHAPRDRGRR